MTVESVKTPMVAESIPASTEKLDVIKDLSRWLYLVVYTVYKTIAIVCQLVNVFYRFLVLLYQYPNATSYAIEVTYNSLLLIYRTGLWDPLNQNKKKERLAKLPTETAIPSPSTPEVENSESGKPLEAQGPNSGKKTN